MTVSQQTPYNAHTGNGVTTVFAYTFRVLLQSDLFVSVDGVVQVSGFTVSGVGANNGGTVTFGTPPANGAAVEIFRDIQLTRQTDYQANGDLLEETLDADFDRIWMRLQDSDARLASAIRAPLGEELDSLPAAAERADSFLAFDADGQPFVTPIVPNPLGALSGFDGTLNYAVGTLGAAIKAQGINLGWFSSVRTAVANGTSAAAAVMAVFQLFATQASGGQEFLFPPGTYLWDSSFIVDVSGVTLRGVPGRTIFKRMDNAPGPTLTTLSGTHTGMNLLQTGFQGRYGAGPSGAATSDLCIDGITFDGNKANNVLNADDNFDNCIAPLYASRTTLRNVVVKNARRIGVALSTGADDCSVIGSYAYSCDYGGFYAEVLENVRFIGCHADSCGTVGALGYGGFCFHDVAGGTMTACTWESCYDGIRVRNRCTDISVVGGSGRKATRYGVYVQDETLGNAFSANASFGSGQMVVSGVGAGTISAGLVVKGTGVIEDTVVVSQLAGTPGGAGIYQLSKTTTSGFIAINGSRDPSRITICGHAMSGCAGDTVYAFHASHVSVYASPIQTDQPYGVHYQNVASGRIDTDVSGATSQGVFVDAGCSNVYEAWSKGQYAPTVFGATTAGAGVYTTQVGRYTKDGNRCKVDASVSYSSHTGAAGDARITLPFVANASSGSPLDCSGYGFAVTGVVQAIVVGGQSYARLMVNNNGVLSPLSVPTTGGSTFLVSGEYELP